MKKVWNMRKPFINNEEYRNLESVKLSFVELDKVIANFKEVIKG